MNQAINSYEEAKKTLQLQKQNKELAKAIYQTTSTKFKEGVGSSFEAVSADNDFTQAKINYLNASPENLKYIEKFDIILNLEIVEHVDNVNLYIKSCYKLLKKNGLMFTATLNRSFISYIKAIIGAEYILRWLPIGTHDWNKFIKPEELEKLLSDEKFSTIDIKGLKFNPFSKKWKKTNDLSVNYIISSLKN